MWNYFGIVYAYVKKMRHMIKVAVVILPIIAVGIEWDSRQGWLILLIVAAFIITNFFNNEQRQEKETRSNRGDD